MNFLELITSYKYPITFTFFALWVVFFDGNSAIFIYRQYQELKELKAQESFLSQEINDMTIEMEVLTSNDEKLEKYARENYFFKKDNEDIYIIEEKID